MIKISFSGFQISTQNESGLNEAPLSPQAEAIGIMTIVTNLSKKKGGKQ